MDKQKKDCLHINIVFTTKTTKIIPEGYEALNEKDNIDLEKYQTTQETHTVFCEDCGEYLEEDC